MNLSRSLFWDVDYDKINWDKNYAWVICRVLDRGGLNILFSQPCLADFRLVGGTGLALQMGHRFSKKSHSHGKK